MVATGKCDTNKLTKYGNNDYVVDDDIVKKIVYASDYICHLPLHANFIDTMSGRSLDTTSIGLTINRFENNKYLHVKGNNAILAINNIPSGLMIFNKSQWTIEYYMQCLGSDCYTNFLSNNPSFLPYTNSVSAPYFVIASIGRNGWHNYFNYNGKRAIGSSNYAPITVGDKLMHRITISFDNGTVKIYKDGNKANVSNNPFTKMQLLNIANWKLWYADKGYTSECYIHDICTWDRVLSDDEVKNHTEFD